MNERIELLCKIRIREFRVISSAITKASELKKEIYKDHSCKRSGKKNHSENYIVLNLKLAHSTCIVT